MISNRILSIDIMRGITLFLMLFVNDLYIPGVPKWLVHTQEWEDGMGLADWVFPGFLFMVGLSIPFAMKTRIKKGQNKTRLWSHVIIRTLSLLLIGVLMVNISRVNPALTTISSGLWAVLVYTCVFLIFNRYPKPSKNTKIFRLLRILGIVGLMVLVAMFTAGTPENPQWIQTGWWGILGLIGWGYFVGATTFLTLRGSFVGTGLIWLLFLLVNICSQLGYFQALDPLDPFIGVLLAGNIPLIVLSGLLMGLLLKKYRMVTVKLLGTFVFVGLFFLLLGFVLHQYFIVSKLLGTPSWAMYCSGISVLLFCVLYLIVDVYKWVAWARIFLPAGQNSLTTYLAPDFIYYGVWGLGLEVFFYKQSESALLAVAGSFVWAFLMIGFAALLSKIHVQLKL